MLNMIMHDGSRHFGDLPEIATWHQMYDYVSGLAGAQATGLITDNITEAWIDFTYSGYKFSINNQFGDYWFFVEDPDCPEQLLQRVLTHFQQMLARDFSRSE